MTRITRICLFCLLIVLATVFLIAVLGPLIWAFIRLLVLILLVYAIWWICAKLTD
jgi:hypothetical protein